MDKKNKKSEIIVIAIGMIYIGTTTRKTSEESASKEKKKEKQWKLNQRIHID